MKKNPILMKVAKGSAMQMNYGSPAKKINLKKLGGKLVNKVKSRIKDKITGTISNVKSAAGNIKKFLNTDED